MRMLGLLVAAALLVPVGVARAQNIKKARKTLNQVLLVDGAGSGLDADTVRGFTPDQLRGAPGPQGPAGPPGPASANASTLNGFTAQQIVDAATSGAAVGIGTALAAFLDSAYFRTATIAVPFGVCNSVTQGCADGNDFLINCGGATRSAAPKPTGSPPRSRRGNRGCSRGKPAPVGSRRRRR